MRYNRTSCEELDAAMDKVKSLKENGMSTGEAVKEAGLTSSQYYSRKYREKSGRYKRSHDSDEVIVKHYSPSKPQAMEALRGTGMFNEKDFSRLDFFLDLMIEEVNRLKEQ